MRRMELHTETLSKNTHLQVRLLWKKCGNAVPTLSRSTILHTWCQM